MNLLKTTNNDSAGQFRTMLIYGETQSGKTSLIGSFARDLHQRTGKITRLIMTDEGGTAAIAPEISEGIIEVVSMVADSLPQSNLMWLAKGAWPSESWPDNKGTLNKPIDIQALTAKVGMIVLDSLSSAAGLVMNFFVNSGMKVAQEVVGLREEQGLKFGAPAMAHFGAVQQFMLQLTTALSGLNVEKIIYTALESKGSDTVDGQIILGPLIAGKALTGVIPSRMNRILHLEIVPSANKEDRSYRIYFEPHVDKTLGRVWPANLRMPLKLKGAIKAEARYAKGYLDFQTGDEVLELFSFCEGLMKPVVVEAPNTAQVALNVLSTKATDAEKIKQLLKK